MSEAQTLEYGKSVEIYRRLSEPIPHNEISLKVQSYNQDKTKGLIVAYINARTVHDRLNSVLGAFGWGDSYEDIVVDSKRWVSRCKLTIYDESGRAVTRSDIGTGSARQADDENVEKAAHSDALKRAGVHYGIGRELYAMPRIWVELVEKGKNRVIKDEAAARAQMFGTQKTSSGNGRSAPSSKPAPTEQSKPAAPESNQSQQEGASTTTAAYATDAQKAAIRTLVKNVLGDDWSKIIEKYAKRTDFKNARTETGNDIDAVLYVMAHDEAIKTIDALEKHAKKLAERHTNNTAA